MRRVALLLLTLLAGGCRFNGMIFHPCPHPQGDWERTSPSMSLEDVWLQTDDGVRLHGWHARAAPTRPARGTLLYFHGNAGNLTTRFAFLERLLRTLPVDVLIIDYRGYGRSQGSPDEPGVTRDATAAWRYLTETLETPPERIVVFGRSLGAAVAIELAARDGVRPAGLITLGGFTRIPDMAPWFLPGFLSRTKMDSLSRIGRVGCPTLVIHAPDDEVIPFSHGERLFAAAREPKELLVYEGATHLTFEGPLLMGRLTAFVDRCLDRRPVMACAPGPEAAPGSSAKRESEARSAVTRLAPAVRPGSLGQPETRRRAPVRRPSRAVCLRSAP